jgi:hypothetical protein
MMKNMNKKDFAQDIPENIKEVTLKALSFYPKLKDVRIEFVFNENIRKSVMQAPVERVYKTMLEDETYRQWTAVFNPGSHYIGSWEKGAKILFIGTDDSGA